MGTLQSIGETINTAREALPQLAPTAEQLKMGAKTVCSNGIQAIKGSGHLTTELVRIGETAVNVPLEAVASVTKGALELCTAHPVKATCTIAKGAVNACADTLKLISSPLPLANATIQTGLRTAGAGLRGTLNAPLTIYRKGDQLFNKAADLLFGDASVAPPANDNASPPPPAASAASATGPTPQAA